MQSFDTTKAVFRYAEPMKLLMISGDRSILQGKKGAFWYTLEEFSRHWERVDIITPSAVAGCGLRVASTRNPFPNVFFHPSPRGLWFQSKWIVEKGRELIAEHHHDVMTAHEYPPFYNGIGACRLHRSTGVPYALEVHHIVGSPAAASFTEWIGRIASRWQIPKSAHHAHSVRVVNQEVKDVLTRWGIPAEKIQIVPSFYLDTQKLTSDPSIPKKYDLVFCARLVRNKGLEVVLRAIAGISNVSLLVIGDGPERLRMEALARSLKITDRVTFRGWVASQEDVIREMQTAKIFVMHSTSEGGPRIALEAMALGMPVIATRVGVLPEVMEDGRNGMFTDGTVGGLAGKIQMALADQSLLQRIGGEAKRILERFERGKLVQQYADFLKGNATR